MVSTFEDNGATYTVRALSVAETQAAVNIAIDVLILVAQKRDWQVAAEDKNRLAAYPFAIQHAAVEYAELYLTTSISGEVKHVMPANLLDAIDPTVFEQWLTDMRNAGDLQTRWVAAYDEANKSATDPQVSSGDEKPKKS